MGESSTFNSKRFQENLSNTEGRLPNQARSENEEGYDSTLISPSPILHYCFLFEIIQYNKPATLSIATACSIGKAST